MHWIKLLIQLVPVYWSRVTRHSSLIIGYLSRVTRHLLLPLLLLLFAFFACEVEVPTEVYENPLDEKHIEEEGIETPALVFFPDSESVKIGESISIEVFAMEAGDIGGAHIQLTYDSNKLSVESVKVGKFFDNGPESLFLPDYESTPGIIDIYAVFLEPGNVSIADTVNLSLAYIRFTADVPGKSILEYTEEKCELVDLDDNPIEIKGFGEGVIDAE